MGTTLHSSKPLGGSGSPGRRGRRPVRRGHALLIGVFCAAFGPFAHAQQAGKAAALAYDSQTREAVPIPPSERGLQSVVAEPWAEVPGDGIVLEGPAFDRSGDLLFCDVSGRRVLRLTAMKELSTVVALDTFAPGGLAVHKDGRVFIAAIDLAKATGIIAAVKPDGSGMEIILPEGAGYAPNDLVFDSRGGLYFTDFRGESTDPKGGVFYIPPDATKPVPVLTRVAKANGVTLGPDGRELWFTEFGRNLLHRLELADATTITPIGSAVAYHFVGPAPDSMRTDADGNVYVAVYGQGRVMAFHKRGIPIGQVLLPGRDEGHNLASTNLALRPGTDELFIVSSDGPGGKGATIFHAKGFAKALRLYSHQ